MTDVVLDAERHFEALRAPVWSRFRARHSALGRDRFEDAYAEWWSRELERAAAGRPSRASAPVPFVTEAVHRVLIDEGRARARGLSRGEKGDLRFTELEALLDQHGDDDTEAQARYEALAHRLLGLVRDRLTPRELQVFVCTFLYLQSTEATARLLGLSAPRVKKDRARVAARLGEDVWALVASELDVCAAHAEARLAAVFEVLADHVEDCEACARSFGGLQRGALAALGPFELLAIAPPEQGATVWDAVYGRAVELFDRFSGMATTMPAGGRGAAAAAVAAVAVAGGGAAAGVAGSSGPPAGDRATPQPAQTATTPTPRIEPPPARAQQDRADRADRKTRARRKRPAPEPDAPITAPAADAGSPAAPQAPPAASEPSPSAPTEFGFERP